MKVTDDPFERAAEREEREEMRREMRRERMWRRGREGTSSMLAMFGIPYVVWALIRAANFDFGEPTLPQSIVRYFFGKWWVFGAYSAWMLFLIWMWAVERTSRR
jgi:hypothetical protein